jgi:hypothetical protein
VRGMSAAASALFATGQVASHTMRTYCEIRLRDEPRAVPVVTGGDVTVDVTASIRRRCRLELLATDDLIPETENDLLYPGRAHLHLWRGIDHGDGRPGVALGAASVEPGLELWPLGVFLLIRTEVTSNARGVALKLDGFDLAKRVERNAWTAPYVVAAGSVVSAAWPALIADRYPAGQVDVRALTDATTAQLVYGDRPESNPWEDARKLAGLAGAEAFCDVEGRFILQSIPDPLTQAVVASHVAADPNVPGSSRLLGVGRVLDAEKGYSEAVVDADRAGATPLRGIAQDTDPSSATYIGGDYGTVPVFVGGSSATTQAAIDAQAGGVLKARQAASDAITVDLVAIPAHEERDVIEVTDPPAHIDGTFAIDSFSMPLDETTTMKAGVRRVA